MHVSVTHPCEPSLHFLCHTAKPTAKLALVVSLLVPAVWCSTLVYCIYKQGQATAGTLHNNEESCREQHMYVWQTDTGRRWLLFLTSTFVLVMATGQLYHHHQRGTLGIGLLNWALVSIVLYALG